MSRETNRTESADTESYVLAVREVAEFIRDRLKEVPSIGIIVGTGFYDFLEVSSSHSECIEIPDVIGGLEGLVERDALLAILRTIEGNSFLCMKGGSYGEQSMPQLAFPVRVMAKLGIHALIVLSHGCSLKPGMKKGDVCIVADHINLLGNSPLVGSNVDEWGPRFPDMTEPYDLSFRQHCVQVVEDNKEKLHEGVLAVLSGVEHKTLDEAGSSYLRRLGADIVSFSVAPEVITARHMDLRVLGIVCIESLCGDGHYAYEAQNDHGEKDRDREVVITLLKAIASLT